MRPSSWIVCLVTVALGVALATTGRAQTLPRLPEEFSFPLGEGSLGRVVFSHRTHVDPQKPECTTCHPALFKILAQGSPTDGEAIGHEEMERGRHCGACHDGKAAFGPDDSDRCMTCHRGSEP